VCSFVSQAFERRLDAISGALGDETLACLLRNCLPNTLDTTVRYYQPPGKVCLASIARPLACGGRLTLAMLAMLQGTGGDAFIVTGDIEAMWLRDSANQIAPYLRWVGVGGDAALAGLVAGLVRRQAAQVVRDPYANAYNLVAAHSPALHGSDDTTRPGFAGTRLR
jgi:meiotically up-regulated gene 157 (Mug157) protein